MAFNALIISQIVNIELTWKINAAMSQWRVVPSVAALFAGGLQRFVQRRHHAIAAEAAAVLALNDD